MAAVYTGNGGGLDRSYLEPERSFALSGSTGVTASSGIRDAQGYEHVTAQVSRAYKPTRREERCAENLIQGLMTV